MMLSGHQPFEGRSSIDVAASILRGEVVPLSTFVNEVPQELSDLVSQMMDPRPSQRPSANQVRHRLEEICRSHQIPSFTVQHKGPASDPQTAWRLRRKVMPDFNSTASVPSQSRPLPPTPAPPQIPSVSPPSPPTPSTVNSRPAPAPKSNDRLPFIAVGVVFLIFLILVVVTFMKS